MDENKEINNQEKVSPKPSKLVVKGVSIGLVVFALGMLILSILSFVAFGKGKGYAIVFAILGLLLFVVTTALLVFNLVTKKAQFLNTLAASISGFSLGIVGIVVGIVVAVVSNGKMGPNKDDARFDDVTTTMYDFPTEDKKGSIGLTVFGGNFEGEYIVPLYPFNDLRVYDCEYTEPTYEIPEKKVYTLKSIDNYAKVLATAKAVKPYEQEDVQDFAFPQNIIAAALESEKQHISNLTVDGNPLTLSLEGFTLDYYAVPGEYDHGYVGMTVNKDNWHGVYGFELPYFADDRYYTNKSVESTDVEGGIVEYELKTNGSLYDLFIHEIMFDFDGLTGQGYYENEEHTDLEKEWFKRCFDHELSQVYLENSLYAYKRPGNPSLINQIRYSINTRSKEAYCVGVSPDYLNTLSKVIIADKVTYKDNEYPVTRINANAFMGNNVIEEVTIGEFVKEVSASAFANCALLETVTFKQHTVASTTVSIGNYAFSSCTSLKHIYTNNVVSSFGEGAFTRCSSLESMIFDDGVKTLKEGCFSRCNKLLAVGFGNNIKAIGRLAFGYDNELQYVDLNKVTTIEDDAFYQCDIAEMLITGTVSSIGVNAFGENDNIHFTVSASNSHFFMYQGCLLEKDDTNYKLVAANYDVGSGDPVFEFGYNEGDRYPISETYFGALSYKQNLKSIKFGPALVSLAEATFLGSANLEYVDLSKTSITVIKSSTFKDCTKLTRFSESTEERHLINGHINTISTLPFENCGIEKLDLGEEPTLSSIQPLAFANMPKLKQLIIPNSVQYMFSRILENCPKLNEDVNFGIIYQGTYEEWRKMSFRADDWWSGMDPQTKIQFASDNTGRSVKDV